MARRTPAAPLASSAPLLPVAHRTKSTEGRKMRKKRNGGRSHGRPLLLTLRIQLLRRGIPRVLLIISLLAASLRLLHVHRATLLSAATAAVLRLRSVTSRRDEPQRQTDPTPTPPIPRLTVGIATVPRKEKYLLATLDSWMRQLPVDPGDYPLHDSVRIVVMNAAAPDRVHQWFDAARRKYSPPHPMSSYVTFVDSQDGDAAPKVEDPRPGASDEGDANVPGYRVRKQTRDIVALMRHSAVRNGTASEGGYFLFSEDDMELCDHGHDAIRHALAKSELRFRRGHGRSDGGGEGDGDGDGFVALRTSFGMNGILLHHPGAGAAAADDVTNLADYLEEHQSRRPPDHLAVEWFAGETDQSAINKKGRVHAAFRYNLFRHLGVSSTLRTEQSNAGHFPGCYEELGEPTLFEVESFDFGGCPQDEDLWPCPATAAHLDRDDGEEESKADKSNGDEGAGRPEKEVGTIPTIAWGRLCTSGKRCLNAKNPARRRRVAPAATTTATTTRNKAPKITKEPPASLVAAVAKYRP